MSSGNHQTEVNPTQHRLGEFLQAAGLISPEQLDEAIEYQCIYGGKLGTSLIELGLIDENQLALILSKQLGQHYIKPEFLLNISASIINIIPEKIALKYHVIPYHEDGKKLFVAMNEARNPVIIHNLSAQLDREIIPLAIPEISLMLALRKYHGMLIPPRYETLSRQINRRTKAAEKVVQKEKSDHSSSTANQKDENHPDGASVWPLPGNAPILAEKNPEDHHASTTSENELNSFNLAKQLANAQNRDDIAEAILSYFKADFPNCALLMVHKEVVTGWLSTIKNSKEPFEQITIPLSEPSIFNLVVTNHSHYLGPIGDSPQNHKIVDFFNIQDSQNVIVFPLMVQKRIVCLLYIQGEIEDLTRRLIELESIADKIELSFKLLILKNKILST